MNRPTKQLIIALIFFLILFGLGVVIYLTNRSAPSCFDGVLNQDEERIDCGGACQSCEIATLKSIEVLWSQALHTRDNFYDLGAQIKNYNQNYGSDEVVYFFKLYDFSDNLINQIEGVTYILPNQSKYLVVVKTESIQPIDRVELSFAPIEWQKLKDYRPPQLIISQKQYSFSEAIGFDQVSAVVINKTNFDFDQIDIDALLFDSEHKLIALNTTQVNTLLSDQERHFTTTWFEPIKGDVVLVEIEAETNLFDSDNYMRRHGASEKFMEY